MFKIPGKKRSMKPRRNRSVDVVVDGYGGIQLNVLCPS